MLVLGIAERLLELFHLGEKMASSAMSVFRKRDSPVDVAASRHAGRIKFEAKRLRAAR